MKTTQRVFRLIHLESELPNSKQPVPFKEFTLPTELSDFLTKHLSVNGAKCSVDTKQFNPLAYELIQRVTHDVGLREVSILASGFVEREHVIELHISMVNPSNKAIIEIYDASNSAR